jgi:hypothetical protein
MGARLPRSIAKKRAVYGFRLPTAKQLAKKLHDVCNKNLSHYPSYAHMSVPGGPGRDGSYLFAIYSAAEVAWTSKSQGKPITGGGSPTAFIRVFPDLEVRIEADGGFPNELLECVIHHAEMADL